MQTLSGTNIIHSAGAWFLIYQLQFEPPEAYYLTSLWEKEFQKAMANYKDPYIKLAYFHSHSLDEELAKNAVVITPRFAVTFIILVVFAILCK